MSDIARIGPTPRHRWPASHDREIPACESPDGNDRNEKDCRNCGITRITVHPPEGFPFHQWRKPDGFVLPISRFTPPCTGMKEGLPE